VARFGGEEFVVLLYNTSEDGATIIAEKMRSVIENLGIINKRLEKFITVSFGVASIVPNKDLKPTNLIDAADQALYHAKKEGRNRVVRSSSLM
jgi:diguanylate cyclase (GGDEF)-like protein